MVVARYLWFSMNRTFFPSARNAMSGIDFYLFFSGRKTSGQRDFAQGPGSRHGDIFVPLHAIYLFQKSEPLYGSKKEKVHHIY